jgi:hypothetical protein
MADGAGVASNISVQVPMVCSYGFGLGDVSVYLRVLLVAWSCVVLDERTEVFWNRAWTR